MFVKVPLKAFPSDCVGIADSQNDILYFSFIVIAFLLFVYNSLSLFSLTLCQANKTVNYNLQYDKYRNNNILKNPNSTMRRMGYKQRYLSKVTVISI